MPNCFICGKEVEDVRQMLNEMFLCEFHNKMVFIYVKTSRAVYRGNGVKSE